ncbi:type VII secretion integral membrane protein EccD [Mycobacterium sp.]|uniref:type VII secretion integral membrane protein EccD n=1 Tax=Mycobacterium sp. TaxID=1785 RepID=UPI003C73F51E
MLPASHPGLRRVSVHSGAAVVDVALPAEVPVAVLIPSIVEILQVRGVDGSGDLAAGRYQLAGPGMPALDKSTTLAQNDIHDGAVLVLSQVSTPLPAPRYHDVAEAVSATLDAAAGPCSHTRRRQAARLTGAVAASSLAGIGGLAVIRNAFAANAAGNLGTTAAVAASAGLVALLGAVIAHRAYRDPIAGLTLSVIATVFAAVAGFVAVPGAPGLPNVLLAATAAAVTSVLALRTSGCGVVPLTAMSCVAMVIAVAALMGVVTAAPLRAIASAAALVSLGLLGVAARVSVVLARLSPRLPPTPDSDDTGPGGDDAAAKAIRADNWLAGLLATFSWAAAIGAITTVLAGAPRLCCIAFGVLTGALLLLRSRCGDDRRTLVSVIGGIVTTGITFGATAVRAPQHGPWLATATAMLVAVAIYLGFAAPAGSLSPVVHRGVELLECSGLVAMVPLTCWICGLYGAVRGLNFR